MAIFWKLVNAVIKESDVLLIVLDARNPELSRNLEIEKKITKLEKRMIYVLNKADLVKQKKPFSLRPHIRMSAKEHKGNMQLHRLLSKIANGKKIKIGVLGYPNTGKSSVINSLKGKGSAGVSSVSGYTKGIQKIRVSKTLVLLDTPGVFPAKKEDEIIHALIGAKDSNQLKDPEDLALQLIDLQKGKIQKKYGVDSKADSDTALQDIAIKLKFLSKGGVPDIQRASKKIIQDMQRESD